VERTVSPSHHSTVGLWLAFGAKTPVLLACAGEALVLSVRGRQDGDHPGHGALCVVFTSAQLLCQLYLLTLLLTARWNAVAALPFRICVGRADGLSDRERADLERRQAHLHRARCVALCCSSRGPLDCSGLGIC
jgi:hypothetical protein